MSDVSFTPDFEPDKSAQFDAEDFDPEADEYEAGMMDGYKLGFDVGEQLALHAQSLAVTEIYRSGLLIGFMDFFTEQMDEVAEIMGDGSSFIEDDDDD